MGNHQEAIRQVSLEDMKEPFYEGSVQKLYAIPDEPDYMVTETTAGGSVFDVGTIFAIDVCNRSPQVLTRTVRRHPLCTLHHRTTSHVQNEKHRSYPWGAHFSKFCETLATSKP